MFIRIFIVLLFFSCAPKIQEFNSLNQNQIVNGKLATDENSFSKHLAGIYRKGETFCTAVIISDYQVLTAAHCEDEVRTKGSRIAFGNTKNQWQYRDILRFKKNSEYDEDIVGIIDRPANDILLIEFKGGLPFGFTPAELPTRDLVKEGELLTVSGFGLDENENFDVLKYTEIKVVEALPYEFKTDEKASGSCAGDSGGPVFKIDENKKTILVGLVSRGDENCQEYGIYENIFYYLDWIKSVFPKNNVPSHK